MLGELGRLGRYPHHSPRGRHRLVFPVGTACRQWPVSKRYGQLGAINVGVDAYVGGFCRDRELMGGLVNRRSTTAVATVVVVLIVGLNAFLLTQTLL